MKTIKTALAALASGCTISLLVIGSTAANEPVAMKPALESLLPRFEVNVGQADAHADFISRGQDHAALIAADRVTVSVSPADHSALSGDQLAQHGKTESRHEAVGRSVFTMRFVGANPQAAKSGINSSPAKANYLLGNQSTNWHVNVPSYGAVKYANIYPGIDAIYYHRDSEFEYDLVIRTGAKLDAVVMEFEGVDNVSVDAQGNLVLRDATGAVARMRKPKAFQEMNGRQRPVEAAYETANNRARILVGAHDTDLALIVDPVLEYRHALGRNKSSAAWAIAVDAQGNAYVTGDTASIDFPLTGALQSAHKGSTDAFVAKIRPDGSIAYSTYLGGSGADVGYAIAIDGAGNAYVTGDTRSPDFPVVNPVQRALKGSADVFVAKLSADGSKLLYSTYVGGSIGERGQGIAVDRDGNAIVVGYTNSSDFPTAEALQRKFAGGNADAFVFKLNPSGSAFVFSTYLGGGNDRPDIATAVALDREGNAYVTGFTNSLDFPVRGVVQPFIGPTDAFVSKLSKTGELVYSTHIGGAADDEAMGIAVDDEGSAYITGQTESVDFPVSQGAFSTKCMPVRVPILSGEICSGGDAFVVKLTPAGNRIAYATFLNGKGFEVGRTITVDAQRNAYVAGVTTSSDFAAVNAVQPTHGGGYDAFAVKLDPTGAKLLFSTYIGGVKDDGAYGIGVDKTGNAYVAGYTMSPNFSSTQSENVSVMQTPALRQAFVIKMGEPSRLGTTK